MKCACRGASSPGRCPWDRCHAQPQRCTKSCLFDLLPPNNQFVKCEQNPSLQSHDGILCPTMINYKAKHDRSMNISLNISMDPSVFEGSTLGLRSTAVLHQTVCHIFAKPADVCASNRLQFARLHPTSPQTSNPLQYFWLPLHQS